MQNFGKIKNIFNSLLVEAIATNDTKKKKIFKEYVKSIKGNKILKAQFLIYNNIEGKVETNEHKATEFVKTNIDVLSKYSKDEIREANMSLTKALLMEDKLPLESNDFSQLHENITSLIFTDKKPKNVDTIVESLSGVVDYIKKNEVKESVEMNHLPNSVLSNIAVDKFNDKYSELSENEKSVFKSILESDEDGKKEIYENLSRECIDLVDKNLVESDIDSKEKLLAVKDRLLRLEFISESFISDISKLIELKNDLSE